MALIVEGFDSINTQVSLRKTPLSNTDKLLWTIVIVNFDRECVIEFIDGDTATRAYNAIVTADIK